LFLRLEEACLCELEQNQVEEKRLKIQKREGNLQNMIPEVKSGQGTNMRELCLTGGSNLLSPETKWKKVRMNVVLALVYLTMVHS
jgi:hypothetical protein